jgi:hypothetical protein
MLSRHSGEQGKQPCSQDLLTAMVISGGDISFTMNRTRRVAAASVLFGVAFLPTNADAATAFQIHSDPTCTNGLSLTNVKMVCTDEDSGGSSTCVFGDSAHVSGTLSIPDSGLFGKSMTSKACLYGAYPCRELQTNGDFCETFGLSQYGCPTTGEYSIEKTFDLPGDQGLSLGTMLRTWKWRRRGCVVLLTLSTRRAYLSRFRLVLCGYIYNCQR